jgi:hypothetical protein
MNFTFTWIMDKLGYMPKINMEVGKVNLDLSVPDLSKPAVKKQVTIDAIQAPITAKASALAKLTALGLSEDEVKALVG